MHAIERGAGAGDAAMQERSTRLAAWLASFGLQVALLAAGQQGGSWAHPRTGGENLLDHILHERGPTLACSPAWIDKGLTVGGGGHWPVAAKVTVTARKEKSSDLGQFMRLSPARLRMPE
eukprot:2984897-Lingulodinium_polyedra.AAC.1